MVTSSPGYAVFNDLRQRMRASSSQPVSTPSRKANAYTVASPSLGSGPRLGSPDMDDVAASQQLIEEGARANPTSSANQRLSKVAGAHDKSASARKRRKKRKLKATQKSPETSTNLPDVAIADDIPTSSPFPFPATQPEAEEIPPSTPGDLHVPPVSSEPSPAVNTLPHPHAVEVPDSQIAATPMRGPASPPISSHVVPSSVTKSKRTYKKSRQAKQDKIVHDALVGESMDGLADTNVGAQDQDSPSRETAPLKRPQVADTDTGFSGAVADVTPAPAKRRKIGTPKSAATVQDLIHTSPNDDEYLQRANKTKLKRVKKPHTPITKPKSIYDIPDDESDPTSGTGEALRSSVANGFMQSGNGGESDNLQETPAHKRSSAQKKKRKSGGEVYHWPASVRKPGQSLSGASENGHYNGELMDDPISSDDGGSPQLPSEDLRSEKKVQKKKEEKEKEKEPPNGEVIRHRRSIGSSINQVSSAERALNTVRDLGHPPDLRTSGDYTADEEELIRRAIKDYQQRKGLDISELVEIIQWNSNDARLHRTPGISRNKNEWTPQDREDMQESTEFWDEIRSIGLTRSHERLRRHIRQLYHQYKTGAWTEEDDEQLRNLQAAYPNQWKLISISMGDRSMHDCVNRWRDYLQHGENRKTSRWTKDEEDLLVRAVTTVAQRDEDYRAETGRPPLDVYTSKDINWPQVVREMGNSRNRIQASVKWSQMMRRSAPPQIEIEYKPRTSVSVVAGASTPTSRNRGRPPKKNRLDEKGEEILRKTPKSQKHVEGSDGEEDIEEPEKQVQDESELVANVVSSKKHRQPEDSYENPQDQVPEQQASTKDASYDSPLPKKKRGRPRKSEAMESNTSQKRHKPSPAEEEWESREADDEHAKDETSDPDGKNTNEEQEKERVQESENEEAGESEALQTSRDVESLETDEDEARSSEARSSEARSSEAEEGQEQDEQEQGDEASYDEGQGEEDQEDESPEDSEATHDSRHDAAEVEEESAVGSAATPAEEHHVLESLAEPGVDQMLWGDKYDLIFKLQDRRDDYEEDIDWEDVRKDQAYPWSEETLKAALQQLIQLLRDKGREVDTDDFPGTIDDVMDLISEEHAAELEEHYRPA